MLQINDLHVHYGGIKALKGVSMAVPQGSIITLIGANGAGKSTTLRAIAGLVRSAQGAILYQGKDISKLPPRDIVKLGVTLVPEGRRVFADMTVFENIRIGAFLRDDQDGVKRDVDFVCSLFPRLKEGARQLAVARALMAKPRLLMMDEPSLGLAPLIIKDIFRTIRQVNEEEKVTVLLVEQNAHLALKTAGYGYVLETGEIGLEGKCEDLLQNEGVKELYLGKA